MEVAGNVAGVLGDVGDESDDVVVGFLLYLVNALDGIWRRCAQLQTQSAPRTRLEATGQFYSFAASFETDIDESYIALIIHSK